MSCADRCSESKLGIGVDSSKSFGGGSGRVCRNEQEMGWTIDFVMISGVTARGRTLGCEDDGAVWCAITILGEDDAASIIYSLLYSFFFIKLSFFISSKYKHDHHTKLQRLYLNMTELQSILRL